MAEYRSKYFTPMDREYYKAIGEPPSQAGLEKPIFPINELGETVPESLGGSNIIQTTQAAIRGGAGTLQLIAVPPQDTLGRTLGGRIGKEVREVIREIALANQVKIESIELPNSVVNLNGFDYNQRAFTEDARQRNLNEVRDAIKFVGDALGGGGVDIISWEFPRAVKDMAWNKKDQLFERESEQERMAFLVDTRSGRTAAVQKDDIQYLPVDPVTFKEFSEEELDPDNPQHKELKPFTWNTFEKWAEENEKYNKEHQAEEQKPTTAEELYVRAQLKAQVDQLRNSQRRSEEFARDSLARIKQYKEEQENAGEEDKKKIQKIIDRLAAERKDYLESAAASLQNMKDLEERQRNYKPLNEYGLKLSVNSYAEMGIEAMRETQVIKERGESSGLPWKPIHVGPEIGWPEYYGSHPDEFKDLIIKSREQMVNLITHKKIIDEKGKEVYSSYFDPNIKREEAEELAKTHIKGLFDTGHVGMWLANFKYENDPATGQKESEEHHISRFNDWFKKKVNELASDPRELVGGIQLVDSKSAAHGHLPPGEGIFPVLETAKIFKDKGYKGFVVSEGHEEERFGKGRIRTKLWQKAGAPVGSGYFAAPMPMRWNHVAQGYFGKTYSPMFMFGSYAPSNEFKLWTEIPLE